MSWSMGVKGFDIVTGDFFSGRLSQTTVREIDARKFYRMLKSGKISESEFLEAITVSNPAAAKLMTLKQLDGISSVQTATPRFNVTAIKGVEVELVQALEGLGAAIRSKSEC